MARHSDRPRLACRAVPPATPVLLDCDPGHDDAVAILLAAGWDAVDLRAVTTVGGNAELEKVTRNARAIMTLAGLHDVPSPPARPARARHRCAPRSTCTARAASTARCCPSRRSRSTRAAPSTSCATRRRACWSRPAR